MKKFILLIIITIYHINFNMVLANDNGIVYKESQIFKNKKSNSNKTKRKNSNNKLEITDFKYDKKLLQKIEKDTDISNKFNSKYVEDKNKLYYIEQNKLNDNLMYSGAIQDEIKKQTGKNYAPVLGYGVTDYLKVEYIIRRLNKRIN